jgi:hypothetical protein
LRLTAFRAGLRLATLRFLVAFFFLRTGIARVGNK